MDQASYAEALRDVCIDENIEVVGLADHGSVSESEMIRKVLTDAGIVVFPGFEVATTEKIHWVCLFPEDTSESTLERFLGSLNLTDPHDGARPSDLGGQQLLATVKELDGFCFAAHVTNRSGLLKQKLNNIWVDPKLQSAQIPGLIDDLPQRYKTIALNQNPDYKRDPPVALINAKDVSHPEDLRNPRASSFIKMTRPCFSSFLIAFKDPKSRVRLSDEIEEQHYSQIESISIEGGYFDNMSAEISSHLNTVIGGRGTGKSTLIECLRYALDVSHKSEDATQQGEQLVRENLGKTRGRVILKLRSAKQYMRPYTVIRRFGEPPRVIDEHHNESLLHPGRDLLPMIEIYGQNEIYEVAKSPGALTHVLDRFMPQNGNQRSRLDSAYRKLRKNGEQLVKAEKKKDEIEMQIAQLPKLEEQVKQFKDQGLEEKLKRVPQLEKERHLIPRIMRELRRVHKGQRQFTESLPDLVFLGDRVLESLPHAAMMRNGRKVLEHLDAVLRKISAEIDTALSTAEAELTAIVAELRRVLESSEAQLDKDFAKLPAVAGKGGREIGHAYRQLLGKIERVRPAKTRLKAVDSLVKELRQTRRNLLGEISDIRSHRSRLKQQAAKTLNQRLAGKLRITVTPDGLSQPLRDFLQSLYGIGVRKTQWVVAARDLTVMGLVAAIRDGKDTLLSKQWGLTPGMAETLISLTLAQIYELESIDLEDRISLELNVSLEKERYRSLEFLSTGQQCTAILHLLLLDNPDPLIMDQPEDNLDNAFIAERIVQELRLAKTERQFLFATHNANIPVFGDAEWIGVCSASEEHAEMPVELQGSIDIPEVRDEVARILEGGKEAFMQRKEKYGFDY